jgi:hypothetical protein
MKKYKDLTKEEQERFKYLYVNTPTGLEAGLYTLVAGIAFTTIVLLLVT